MFRCPLPASYRPREAVRPFDPPLVDLLACPDCGRPLSVLAGADTGPTAEVVCELGHSFPVRSGIPRLVATDRSDRAHEDATSESFAYEFTVVVPPRVSERKVKEDVIAFFRATGIDRHVYARLKNAPKRRDLTPEEIGYVPDGSWLTGKLVLDAGCGAGRFTALAAGYGARVVGLDRSEAVDRAAASCAPYAQRASFVQGDLLRPPLRQGAFDVVFSIGVLHHAADTRRGVLSLARLLRPGGMLIVWVYPHAYWGGPVRGAITRALRRLILRLPMRSREMIFRRLFYPLGRVQMVLAERAWSKRLFAPLFVLNIPRHQERDVMLEHIFDYWSSPVIRTHTNEELYDWFVEAGLEDIEILPYPVAVRGKRSRPSEMGLS